MRGDYPIPDYSRIMITPKGHSIFAHSRSSTSEEFSLFIIRYMLSEYRENKTAQMLCRFSICEKVMNRVGYENSGKETFVALAALSLIAIT